MESLQGEGTVFYAHLYKKAEELYLSLVRPHLEYATQLWDPYAQRDIYELESVQKFALKLVTHQWDSSYDDLLSLVNVPKLSVRRLNLKLAQVFKIVHGLCYFPDNIFRMQPSHSSRLSRTDTIYCPFARTNLQTTDKLLKQGQTLPGVLVLTMLLQTVV